jgi:hypothetical protein
VESNHATSRQEGWDEDKEEGMHMRKRVLIVLLTGVFTLVGAASALAAKPGPGSKQCVPGQQGNPHPAHKAGAC